MLGAFCRNTSTSFGSTTIVSYVSIASVNSIVACAGSNLAGVNAVLEERGLPELLRSLKLLGAVDIIFVMLGVWLFAYVVED